MKCISLLLTAVQGGSPDDYLADAWQSIRDGDIEKFDRLVMAVPNVIDSRSEDGRGVIWWIYEFGGDRDLLGTLIALGRNVMPDDTDTHGKRPTDLLPEGKNLQAVLQDATEALPDVLARFEEIRNQSTQAPQQVEYVSPTVRIALTEDDIDEEL